MKYLAAAMLILFTGSAGAGEPVQNVDALEKDIQSCLLKEAKTGKCFSTLLGGRILPGNDQMAPIAGQMDELLVTWLADDKIYAMHPLSRKPLGDIYEKRTYVLEDTSGALMLFELAFLKRLGKWYVLKFNVNSKTEALQKAFNEED